MSELFIKRSGGGKISAIKCINRYMVIGIGIAAVFGKLCGMDSHGSRGGR